MKYNKLEKTFKSGIFVYTFTLEYGKLSRELFCSYVGFDVFVSRTFKIIHLNHYITDGVQCNYIASLYR